MNKLLYEELNDLDLEELIQIRNEIYENITIYEKYEHLPVETYLENNQYLSVVSRIIHDKKQEEGVNNNHTNFSRNFIKHSNLNSFSQYLTDESIKLSKISRNQEALVLINIAIEIDSSDYIVHNTKAIILENLSLNETALKVYDKSIELKHDCDLVRINKILLLCDMAKNLLKTNPKKGLKLINESLNFASTLICDYDTSYQYVIKGDLLRKLNKHIDAYEAYLISRGLDDQLNIFYNHLKLFEKYSDEILINITGVHIYNYYKPFKRGVILDLIKEPENEYDNDAIKVEINSEVVGYVANSQKTLIHNVKSASELQNIIGDSQQAEVLFIFMDNYIIARLINEKTKLIKNKFKEEYEFLKEMDDLTKLLKDYD